MSEPQARHWLCNGLVQGVGFRPFVYRLAHRHQLDGWVRNRSGQVEILAQGAADALDSFAASLIKEAPAAAAPRIVRSERRAPLPLRGFTILDSESAAAPDITIAADSAPCDDCLRDMRDPRDRRYRYPFITCAACGPRYTIIQALPYDRANTAMAGFGLCVACRAEYQDPGDRRFHAETIACAACGPALSFRPGAAFPRAAAIIGEAALQACARALARGEIIAVKGIGGYHLMADATDDSCVERLRARKHRPDKPFAVMFPETDGLAALRRQAMCGRAEESVLRAAARPVLLLPLRGTDGRRAGDLAPAIAPRCAEIGAMLPSSPLHHLLLEAVGRPLVATSANRSGEPVLTEAAMVEELLACIADGFLHHDRPIIRAADDPVFRPIAGRPRAIRVGRGTAPLEIALPFTLREPVLAFGGHLRASVTLAWDRRAVMSQHLGDMNSPRALALLERAAADLQRLYGVRAARFVCDAHADYATTRLARRLGRETGLPVGRVHHHHAHASALVGEQPHPGPWLVFAWDGTGLGIDGTLWGGEALLGVPGAWRRVATFRRFAPLGGERAALEPWRSALALTWETGGTWSGADDETAPRERAVMRAAWERGVNCPATSSVGRLFDGAAALTGLLHRAGYEGQAPMLLEAACAGEPEATPVPLPLRADADGVLVTDWEPLLVLLCDDTRSAAERAALFHASLAHALIAQAEAIREVHGPVRLGLAGGVFQNRRLTGHAIRLAESTGFTLVPGGNVPMNDAGLSFGQIIDQGWKQDQEREGCPR